MIGLFPGLTVNPLLKQVLVQKVNSFSVFAAKNYGRNPNNISSTSSLVLIQTNVYAYSKFSAAAEDRGLVII